MPRRETKSLSGQRENADHIAAFQRCVSYASEQMGVSDYHTITLLSHFLEKVGDELSAGRCVVLPRWGLFGPRLWVPRKPGLSPICLPSFAPTPGFINQVSGECPTSCKGAVEFRTYSKKRCVPMRSRMGIRMRRSLGHMRKYIKGKANRLGVKI